MENWIFLFLAYTAGWLGVLFYIFLNSRKQAAIERKIKDLESDRKSGEIEIAERQKRIQQLSKKEQEISATPQEAKEVFDGEEVEAKPNPNRERCRNGINQLLKDKIIDFDTWTARVNDLEKVKDGDLEELLKKIKNEYRNGKIVLETEFKDDDSSASPAHYKKGFEGKELF
ncbi:hypothetical protein LCGC14_2873990 [marine sediment metagenome]|uniref:Uncharacterized protein n=1 Tax=marine sediment metagenome TaxID=412755 RepID=A0A0F8Y2B1_9ZZZZ